MNTTHEFVSQNGDATVLVSHLVDGQKRYFEIALKKQPVGKRFVRWTYDIVNRVRNTDGIEPGNSGSHFMATVQSNFKRRL